MAKKSDTPPGAANPSIMSEPSQEEISMRAYQNYVKKGRPHGQDLENWLEAEAQLRRERGRRARM